MHEMDLQIATTISITKGIATQTVNAPTNSRVELALGLPELASVVGLFEEAERIILSRVLSTT